MILWHVLLTLLSLILLLAAIRYAFFAILSRVQPPPVLPPREAATRFCVLVPAHNEGPNVRSTVEAARRLAYPADRFRVVVLADNCTDDTAAQARDAGAETIERRQPESPGKGQAVAWAIANHLRPDEALVICDADSRPAPDYLDWMNRALASGYGAAQGFNGSANPEESGLAALAAVTSGMKNAFHYTGKAAAGLPAPLMNGLTLAAATWHAHPWRAFSIVEDFETYLNLVAADVPIRFVPEAKILSPRASGFRAASSQKQRWSGGQSKLAREVAWPLARRGLRERSWPKLSAALDLLAPGYAPTTAWLLVTAVVGRWSLGPAAHPAVGLALAGLLLMGAQFAAGLARLRRTPRLALAVLLAPVYLVWKMALSLRAFRRAPERWQRSARPGDE